MIRDVRSITRDAGTVTAQATFTGPIGIYMKTLASADPMAQDRGRVQWHFLANLTIDLRTDFVQKWSIDP